jgi:hypothetical protein
MTAAVVIKNKMDKKQFVNLFNEFFTFHQIDQLNNLIYLINSASCKTCNKKLLKNINSMISRIGKTQKPIIIRNKKLFTTNNLVKNGVFIRNINAIKDSLRYFEEMCFISNFQLKKEFNILKENNIVIQKNRSDRFTLRKGVHYLVYRLYSGYVTIEKVSNYSYGEKFLYKQYKDLQQLAIRYFNLVKGKQLDL